MTYKIITAKAEHIPGIFKLWKYMMKYHRELDPVVFPPITRAGDLSWAKYIRKMSGSGKSAVLVALDKDAVVAYTIISIGKFPPIYRIKKYGFIDTLCVGPDYQRQGIGKQMLDRIYAWFKTRKLRQIHLHAISRNKKGFGFWAKHGFKERMQTLYLNRP